MEQYYLAIDIGASSGRHILGHLEEGRMVLEEVHRFSQRNGGRGRRACVDVDRLFEEIKDRNEKM